MIRHIIYIYNNIIVLAQQHTDTDTDTHNIEIVSDLM